METIAKPDELLALHDVTEELFGMLKTWFAVPDEVALNLGDIDSAVTQLADPVAIAALAMRKLQALRLLAQPGVRTSTDVVITIVQDLERALVQAPAMRLKRAASVADWDAEFEVLLDDLGNPAGADAAPASAEAEIAEVARFRELHAHLHHAVRAVLEASQGEIRYLL